MVFVVYARPSGHMVTTQLHMDKQPSAHAWYHSPTSRSLGLRLKVIQQDGSSEPCTSEQLIISSSQNTPVNSLFMNTQVTAANFGREITIQPLRGDVVIARTDMGDLSWEVVESLVQYIKCTTWKLQTAVKLAQSQGPAQVEKVTAEAARAFRRAEGVASFEYTCQHMVGLGWERFAQIPNLFQREKTGLDASSGTLKICGSCGERSLYMISCKGCNVVDYCGNRCLGGLMAMHGRHCTFVLAHERLGKKDSGTQLSMEKDVQKAAVVRKEDEGSAPAGQENREAESAERESWRHVVGF